MRTLLFLMGGIALANIGAATFFWYPPAQATGKPEPVVNSATVKGQEPWMANEPYIESNRQSARKSALEALGKPWSTFCEAAGKKRLIESIDAYLWQRTGQLASYPKNWGEPGRRYIAKAWTTPDDSRVERMTRETYGRGFFSLEDFKPYTRSPLAELVKGERVTAKRCAG
jgi:hypothetical protein